MVSRRRSARGAGLAAVAFVASLLVGCSHGSGSLTVRVAPHDSLLDEPVHVTVSGAPAGALTTVEVESTDASGVRWRSTATFRADAEGDVDADTGASVSGTYTGVAGSGLVWSMQPTGDETARYRWGNGASQSFSVTAHADGSAGSTVFARALAPEQLTTRTASLAADGFVGELFAKPGASERPAVLVVGGSEGGLQNAVLAGMLAERGYPTLEVAYLDEPGLPQQLASIPLEYFERALTWLGKQPEVDPSRVVVLGGSRGSEAALLLGVHDPAQVHGVIGASPSDVAGCSIPACDGPAWTLGGKPVAYTEQPSTPHPTDVPGAVIPVARIRGPVLLVCGEDDTEWASCGFARAATAALDADPHPPAHELVAVPGVGHFVGELVPGEPERSPADLTPQDKAAIEAVLPGVWRHVLAYLTALG